jgi:hypothetical protein
VLHIEEEPVEAGNGHGFRDLDAARHAHANAERQLPLLELFAGDIADSGGHRQLPRAIWKIDGDGMTHLRAAVMDCHYAVVAGDVRSRTSRKVGFTGSPA